MKKKQSSKQPSIQYYIAVYFICFAVVTVLSISIVAYFTIKVDLNQAAYRIFDRQLTEVVDNINLSLLRKKNELKKAISTTHFKQQLSALDKGQIDLSNFTHDSMLPGLPEQYKYEVIMGRSKTGNFTIYPNKSFPDKFAKILLSYPEGGVFFVDYMNFKGWIIFSPVIIEDKISHIVILRIKFNNLNENFAGIKYKRVKNKMFFTINKILEITAQCKIIDNIAYYNFNNTEVHKKIHLGSEYSIKQLTNNAFYFIIIPLIIIQLLMVLFGVLTFRNLIIKPINRLTRYIIAIGMKKSDLTKEGNLRCKELNLFRDIFNRIILKIRKREEMLVDGNLKLETSLDKLRKLQQQLLQTEKMASLGKLTSGVAHEINNPLNSIGLNIATMKEYVDDIRAGINNYNLYIEDLSKKLNNNIRGLNKVRTPANEIDFDFLLNDSKNLLDESGEALEKILKISMSLKSFSLENNLELKEVRINNLLELNIKILFSKLNNNITIEKDFKKLPSIIANPENLSRAFIQLLENAYDAVKNQKNGIIKVETELRGNQIYIAFADNGCGIARDIIDKIFDPFFTTKDIGEGIGLGLHLVYKIIKAYNGNISVVSSKKKGTRFEILIPLSIE